MRAHYKLILIGLTISCFSCDGDFNAFNNCEQIIGSGSITTRTLDIVEDISEIELNIPVEFIITGGSSQEIVIEGHPNVLDIIESDSNVTGSKWKILNENFCINSDETKIYAQLTSLESFEVNGVADIKSEGTLDIIAESLQLEVNGAGKLELDFTSNKKIDFQLDGAGEIILNGITEYTNINVNGASRVKLHEMTSITCDININGASNVEVNVSTELKVEINGSGKVCYLGTPTITTDIDGVGTVLNCN